MARGNGHLPTADVIDWARGEDARVAGVYGMRGGKTPALRAGLIGRGLDASALKGRQNTARGVAERNPGMTRARIEPTGRNRATRARIANGDRAPKARIERKRNRAPKARIEPIGRNRATRARIA